MEILFTNVPVDETIDLIHDQVYRNYHYNKRNIPEEASPYLY